MAKTIDCATLEKITVAECLEAAIATVDPNCPDTIVEFSPQLKKLSNNREAVSAILYQYLKEFATIEYGGLNYSPNSFLLSAIHDNFLIRANIWLPLTTDPDRQIFESRLFAYHRAHNHNFHILTIGHFGPGYFTDIYTYDRNEITGHIGEVVSISFSERAQLAPGKIMFYESGKDIHTQFPASSASVSLNLIVVSDEDRLRDQYFFDTEKSVISGFSDTLATKRVSLLTIAAYLADANTIDVLTHIASNHLCHRTRLQALRSLMIAQPRDSERWLSIAQKDRSFPIQAVTLSTALANEQTTFDSAFIQLI